MQRAAVGKEVWREAIKLGQVERAHLRCDRARQSTGCSATRRQETKVHGIASLDGAQRVITTAGPCEEYEIRVASEKDDAAVFLLSTLRHCRRMRIRTRVDMTDSARTFRSEHFQLVLRQLDPKLKTSGPAHQRPAGRWSTSHPHLVCTCPHLPEI